MNQEPTERAVVLDAEGGVEDPFAVDLFAAGRAAATADVQTPHAAQPAADTPSAAADARPAWHERLPKVAREEARRSAALSLLPPTLSDDARAAVARALSRLARIPPEEIALAVVGLRETNLSEFAREGGAAVAAARAPRLLAVSCVEPEGGCVALQLGAQSASAVADLLLGGDGSTAPLRPVTATERALVEFLCLVVVAELNALAGEPLLRVAAVTDESGAESALGGGDPAARVLAVTVRAQLGARATPLLVRLAFDDAALSALDTGANPLLRRLRAQRGTDGRVALFRELAADAPLRLRVGETTLGALDLAALEEGDIVVVTRPLAARGGGRFGGSLTLLAGAGEGFVVRGAARDAADGALAVAVETITAEAERGAGGRLNVEDERRLETDDDSAAAALEGIMLTLRVELPAGRISLEELSRLRAGQILELGCRPTDPVDLVADGRRVAAGELVDIEGGLGVRVTRLLG